MSQLPAEFLTGIGPVVADVVSKFRHMALDFQFILLEPRDVELLTRDVLVIITDNSRALSAICNLQLFQGQYEPRDNASRANTFSALGDKELPLGLNGGINVIALGSLVREIVMRDIVDLVFLEEFRGHNPRAIGNDFIDPFAMTKRFCSLRTAQHGQAFPLMRILITRYADNQIDLGKGLFGLFELSHVSVPSNLATVQKFKVSKQHTPDGTDQKLHPHRLGQADLQAEDWCGNQLDSAIRPWQEEPSVCCPFLLMMMMNPFLP